MLKNIIKYKGYYEKTEPKKLAIFVFSFLTSASLKLAEIIYINSYLVMFLFSVFGYIDNKEFFIYHTLFIWQKYLIPNFKFQFE